MLNIYISIYNHHYFSLWCLLLMIQISRSTFCLQISTMELTIDTIEVDVRKNERFHLFPAERIKSVSILAGGVGFFSGFYEGIKLSSLRYLTENSHRLPKNVGGWYFYHKKKNYIMLTNGFKTGFKHSLKYSFLVSLFFGSEALIDRIRGEIDLFNTILNSTFFFTAYGVYNKLSKVQTITYGRRGLLFGMSLGLCQDLMIWTRGGNVWYLEKLGIHNPRLGNQISSSVWHRVNKYL